MNTTHRISIESAHWFPAVIPFLYKAMSDPKLEPAHGGPVGSDFNTSTNFVFAAEARSIQKCHL